MYLSFFIKLETRVLFEVKNALQFAGFQDIKTTGEPEKQRIIIFNGRKEGNFSYTAHKLIEKVDCRCPFLVRVGTDWTMQGLIQILTNYAKFRIQDFSLLHFPKKEDYSQLAIDNSVFLQRLRGMRRALQHCELTNHKAVKKFKAIEDNISFKTIAEVKKEILYFFIEERIQLPWGDPPTSKKSKDLLIDWIKLAGEAFPAKKTTIKQYSEDIKKIKKLKDTQKIELT